VLSVSVTRGPRVTVAFTGDSLSENERERLVPIRAEASADEDLLEDSKFGIERHFRERGYCIPRADYQRTTTGGVLRIVFTVSHGPQCVLEREEITGNAAVPLAEQSVPADEVGLGQVDEAVEPGLERREAGLEILLPAAVALVETQRLDGIDADVADPAGRTRRHDGLVGRNKLLQRQMQLPAELAHIVDPQSQGTAEAELNVARRQPGEGSIGEIGRGHLLQHLACCGTSDHERAEAPVHTL